MKKASLLNLKSIFLNPLKIAVVFFIFFAMPVMAHAATEFVSIVDPDNASGTDYTALSSWESGVQTDLTSAATQVFSGTRTSAIADNATVYLCRSGAYQSHSGTLVHVTATQILVESISGSATEQSGDIWYTNNSCNSSNYFTLSNGGDSAIAVASVRASNGTADTTALNISGWTTDATHYIKVWTDPTTSARHSGKWDDGKYRLSISNYFGPILIQEDFVQITGLQMEETTSGGSDPNGGIQIVNAQNGTVIIQSNIIRKINSLSSGDVYGIYATTADAYPMTFKIINNVIYNFKQQINFYGHNGESHLVYNNTLYGGLYGIRTTVYGSNDVGMYKNNIMYNNSVANWYLSQTYTTYSTSNNLTQDATSPNSGSTDCGGHSCRSQTVTLEDEANKDFHLSSYDTAAKGAGTNLYADSNLAVTTDIDNQGRPTSASGVPFDIGADQTVMPIYRSVGPSATTALATGTSNALTISGSTASFASALPDNVGVGDAIQYDSDNNSSIDSIAFIYRRNSSASYTVKTASGAAPTAVSGDTDWSLFRAYTSLANAETGTENTGIDSGVRNFDTWSGGKDLVASNEQWNIAAYANGTTGDTSRVLVDSWSGGDQNFLKIYTPYLVNEVGISQRHPGKWDDNKYKFDYTASDYSAAIYIGTNNNLHIRIEGLQISENNNGSTNFGGIYIAYVNSPSQVYISNNIIRGILSGGGSTGSGIYSGYNYTTIKAWNNIVYGFSTGIWGSKANDFFYNNTVYSCATGYDSGYQSTTWRNNIAQNCTNGFNGNLGSSSDYNLSDLAADAPGSNSKNSTTVFFVDAANKDFHLAPTDIAAKNAGVDLSRDSYLPFDSDIDGENRSGAGTGWDIGADEQRSNPNPVNINRNVQFKPGTIFKAIR